MTRAQAILVTLLCYKAVLILIGFWASRRTHDDGDFFLGGRKLGGWVAALSASASSSSAWTLLGVSGAAYAWGLSAIWLFPATLSGFLINWLWLAPRLMEQSRASNSLTLTEFIAGDRAGRHYRHIMRVSSVAIVFSFMFYIASQFQAAGLAFASSFGISTNGSIALGVAIIVVYTLLGGFWAVSVTDTLQGLLMVGTATILPLVALGAVGGPSGLASGLARVSSTGQMQLFGPWGGGMAIAFVLGTLGIGLGYPGQPHVVNRFMALRDPRALRHGRFVAITWALIIYSGMLLLGWCGRVLFREIPDGEQIFFQTANELLPAVIAGVMIAAVLSAIMSTADSQLLVAASSISWDWNRAKRDSSPHSLVQTRVVVLGVSLVAMLIAMFAPAAIFSRVLFAWHAIGSAFGPVLVLRLAGRPLSGGAVLASICTGFGLTVVLHLLPDAPGDALERLLPLVSAFVVAVVGSRRSNVERE